MQNLENRDKILKIFSRVRCFNKDQLPRYVDGRLTHVEKHLLEQHLVNCELCSNAVEILQKPKFKTQYQLMGARVQHYIRNSASIEPVYEAERYQKNVQIKENFLIYFWGTVAAALLIGCFYLAQQQVEKESRQTSSVQLVNTTPPATPTATRQKDSTGITLPASLAATGSTPNPVLFQHENTVTASVADNSGNAETDADIPAGETADPDKSLYKTAMAFYLQGNLDEAMTRFTKLTTDTSSRYRELAHYQLAMCFKYRRQKNKARLLFQELVHMNGRMKKRAQLALYKL